MTGHVAQDSLGRFYHLLAVRLGAPESEALTFSRCIVRADLRVKYTQGAAIVPCPVSLVEAGLARFAVRWTPVSESGAGEYTDDPSRKAVGGTPLSRMRGGRGTRRCSSWRWTRHLSAPGTTLRCPTICD